MLNGFSLGNSSQSSPLPSNGRAYVRAISTSRRQREAGLLHMKKTAPSPGSFFRVPVENLHYFTPMHMYPHCWERRLPQSKVPVGWGHFAARLSRLTHVTVGNLRDKFELCGVPVENSEPPHPRERNQTSRASTRGEKKKPTVQCNERLS